MPLKTYVISPPFGNWISWPNATPVRGTFTLEPRPGLIKHAVRTIRPVNGGWVNRVGLRNPGITSVRFRTGPMYSIAGINDGDWERMFDLIPAGTLVEVNLGCPNVHDYGIEPYVLEEYCRKFKVSVKIPPTKSAFELAEMAVNVGTHFLHCCNTLPTERGGESGRRLREITIPIIKRVHSKYPNVAIIGGGGIYSRDHVFQYAVAGARHFSLATVWFNPLKALRILTKHKPV